MPLSLPEYETLFDQILAFFRNRFPGKDDHGESFIGKTARAVAMSLFGLLRAVKAVDNDAAPSPNTSSQGLRTWAFVFGVPSDTEGDFGPKKATIATGGQGYCTGTLGTVFPDGARLTAPDGQTEIRLSGSATIPGSPPGAGKGLGSFVAVTPGTAGNLPKGSELAWQSPPSGADAKVILTAALRGALDGETDGSLLQRTYDRMQKPPKGGAANDYRTWAESVEGVFRAFVYPLRGGMDTVQVVITTGGSGVSRVPADAVRVAVDDYINSQRPVTVEGYKTLLPRTVAPGMAIQIRVVPSPKYLFPWSSAGSAFTVAAYSPPLTTDATLTLSAPPPDGLVNAIKKAAAGLVPAFPQVQVIASGPAATPLPVLLPCTAAAGSVLTVSGGPPAGVINVGDSVFPGGAVVMPIARAVLAYGDSLGPSRQSGLVDPNDVWEDTCSIGRLIQIALDAKDAKGAPLCRNVVTNGTTIDSNSEDRQATDATGGPPELLFIRSIAITD